ncbi:MAG TPA: lysophospholipid acyltransferase family protein [Thermoanaerobaculia bacterium]|nr:lysophospholipid acyltransferase family protein [Thermoanaerobaculia bacterium]
MSRRGRWRTRPRANRLRMALLAGLLGALSALLGALSWRGAQRAGAALGRLGWHLAGRDRRRTLDHLALALPELPEPARLALGRACFRHLGTTLAECLHLLRRGRPAVLAHVSVEGWEEVESARAAGRPVLILTGHCGNWELLAAAINLRGLGMAVVARPLDDPGLQAMLADLRARFGTPTIARGSEGAARQLLATLRTGGALGMLIDQDTKVEGVWVPFLGRPAFTPVGAAKIALRQGAAVIPAFIERLSDGSHRAAFHPALELPDDPETATEVMSRAIEEQVRRVPEQWVWLHRRWRRQPPPMDRRQPAIDRPEPPA